MLADADRATKYATTGSGIPRGTSHGTCPGGATCRAALAAAGFINPLNQAA